MSYQSLGFTHTLPAGADLRTHIMKFVMVNSSSKLVLPSNGGDAIGVTLDKCNTDQACPFQQLGIAQVMLAGTVTPGQLVSSNASGEAQVATTGHTVLGICVVGGAVGQVGAILLTPNVTAVSP